MPYTIVTANTPGKMRQKWRAARMLADTGADSIGLSEGQGLWSQMPPKGPLRAYRKTWNPAARDRRRGAKDTAVLTRRTLPSLGSLTLQASELVPASSRVAPDRWITVECHANPELGPVAHVNVHPNAAVMGRSRAVARVREYAEHSDSLDNVLDFLRHEGFSTFLTGDLNWRKRVKADWSPYAVLSAHGMRSIVTGLDCIAYDPKRVTRVRDRVLSRALHGSDHDWLVATFAAR